MSVRLEFFDEAAEEAEHERQWYRQRSESAEAAFLRELDHAVASVLEFPNMWPRYIAGTHRYVFPTFPFSLIYFVESDVLNVVAVAAEYREPGYWRDRMLKRR